MFNYKTISTAIVASIIILFATYGLGRAGITLVDQSNKRIAEIQDRQMILTSMADQQRSIIKTAETTIDGLKSEHDLLQQEKNPLLAVVKQDRIRQLIEAKAQVLYLTSYNPEAGQTDSTPCKAGGTGIDLCEGAKQGKRYLALSQDLIDWAMFKQCKDEACFKAGDKVELVQLDGTDARCNGEFIVADAMNARFSNRGDLFFMNRKDNTSCNAIIIKK